MKRTRDTSAGDLWRREIGDLTPGPFAHRSAASEDLVMRFMVQRKLNRHTGCVNTVGFNSYGDTLISGSDDQMVLLWNWDAGVVRYSFHSGHANNVFQARFMPLSDDRTIVTCAADGEVRLAKLPERGDAITSLLGEHEGRAHKLAIEPGSPYVFYSCGEDGLVKHFDLRTNTATDLFVCRTSWSRRVVQLNAISIDPRNPNLFAIGGSTVSALVYDIRKYRWDGSSDFGQPAIFYSPPHLIRGKGTRFSGAGITGLAYSQQSELLVSYNDELIYLFSKDQGVGTDPMSTPGEGTEQASNCDPATASLPVPKVYEGHRNSETVKGVSFFGPNCEYVTSGSDCGRLFIWRKNDGLLLRAMDGDQHVVNCIEQHPHTPVLASSGIDHDVKIWTPSALDKAAPVNIDELKSNKRTNKFWKFSLSEDLIRQVLSLRRRRTESEENGEEADEIDLARLLMNATGGGASDDEDDDEPSDGPGECIVN